MSDSNRKNPSRRRGSSNGLPRPGAAALTCCLFTVAVAVAVAVAFPASAEDAEPQVHFEGTWSFEGHKVSESEQGALFVTTGEARIATDGKEIAFATRCLGASDQENGGIARCRWSAGPEDSILLDLSGTIIGPMGTLREAQGRLLAGTGRFAGIQGEVQLDWLFIDSVFEEGKITGSSSDIEGWWKHSPLAQQP